MSGRHISLMAIVGGYGGGSCRESPGNLQKKRNVAASISSRLLLITRCDFAGVCNQCLMVFA
jgi:hypothetical protein